MTPQGSRGKTPRIGDVIEVDTANGRAYAQYCYEDAGRTGLGALLRVLPGFFTARPASFTELVAMPERYFVYFPVRAAVRSGEVSIVGHEPVPEWARDAPLMRWGLPMPDKTGGRPRVHVWWLMRGNERLEPPIPAEDLSVEQERLSLREQVNYPALVSRLEAGWEPAHRRD